MSLCEYDSVTPYSDCPEGSGLSPCAEVESTSPIDSDLHGNDKKGRPDE